MRGRGGLRAGRRRRLLRRRRRGADDHDGLDQGRRVDILSVHDRHLRHGLEYRGGDHLSREARRGENVSGHLIPLRDNGHRSDDRRQPGERRMGANDVSYTICGRSVLHHGRARRFTCRRLERYACVAQR